MFIQVCFNDDPRERVGPKWEGVEFLYWNGINTKKVKNRILKHPYKKLSLMFNLIFFILYSKEGLKVLFGSLLLPMWAM